MSNIGGPHVIGILGFQREFQVLCQVVSYPLQVAGRGSVLLECIDWHGGFMIPIYVELLGNLVDGRPGDQHVEVVEVRVLLRIEVLVADVPATHYRVLIVRRQRFVVHASVDAGGVCEEVDILEISCGKLIEKANGDIRVRVQSVKLRVQRLVVEVVQQHSHPHTPIGRVQHMLQQDLTGKILVPEKVLKVQRTLCALDQNRTDIECIDAVNQWNHARFVHVTLAVGDGPQAEGGSFSAGDGGGLFGMVVLRQLRAGAQDRRARAQGSNCQCFHRDALLLVGRNGRRRPEDERHPDRRVIRGIVG